MYRQTLSVKFVVAAETDYSVLARYQVYYLQAFIQDLQNGSDKEGKGQGILDRSAKGAE
jgi:hypothetical protein